LNSNSTKNIELKLKVLYRDLYFILTNSYNLILELVASTIASSLVLVLGLTPSKASLFLFLLVTGSLSSLDILLLPNIIIELALGIILSSV